MHAGVVVLAGDWYLAFSAHFLTLALLGNFWRVPEGVIMAIAPLYNTVLLAVAGLWWPEA